MFGFRSEREMLLFVSSDGRAAGETGVFGDLSDPCPMRLVSGKRMFCIVLARKDEIPAARTGGAEERLFRNERSLREVSGLSGTSRNRIGQSGRLLKRIRPAFGFLRRVAVLKHKNTGRMRILPNRRKGRGALRPAFPERGVLRRLFDDTGETCLVFDRY